jgi:hypothetical protein
VNPYCCLLVSPVTCLCPHAKVAQAVPSGELIEIDDWLVDLIGLIKETAGIDPDK